MKFVIRKETRKYEWSPEETYDSIDDMPDEVARGVVLLDAAAGDTQGRYTLEGVGMRLWDKNDGDVYNYYLDIHAWKSRRGIL